MKFKFTLIITCLLVYSSILGCSSKGSDYTKDAFLAGAEYQHKKATSLTLLRYISIIEDTENSKTNKIREDVDYWIDLGIIELNFQENAKASKKLPSELQNEINKIKKDLNTNQPDAPSDELINSKIAKYRKEHPRIHSIPLDEKQKKLIDNFVKKYYEAK